MQLKEYKLGDIGRVVTGKTPATSNNVNFEGGTIPFYTPEDVAKGFDIKSGNKRFITSLGFEEIKNNTIAGESVLVGCIGSDMGNVAYVNEICATNQQINSITDFKEFVEPLYVYYLLSTMKPIFRQLAGSTTTPILAKSVFENITISLPRLETQKRVCKILSSFDSKIVLNRQINQNLEALARQLYDYWFVQFDFPNEEGKPYKSSGGKMIYNPILKREIPEGWEVKKLFDAVDVLYGFPFNADLFTEKETNIPVVRIRDILEGNTTTYTTENVHERYKLEAQDVLVGMDGNFHMSIWNDNISYLNQRCVRLRTLKESNISALQLFYSIQPYIKYREKTIIGSTVGHLSDKDMKALYVVEPKTNPYFSPRTMLELMSQQIIENKQQIKDLTKQRDELLPLLMNGQVNFDLSDD